VTGPHAARRDRLRTLVGETAGIDALLVTDLANVRYLTGFAGSNAVLLLAADGVDVFGTDGRYAEQAATQVPDLAAVLDRDTVSAVAATAGRRRLGVESTASLADAETVRTAAGEPVVVDGLVEGLRAIKDDAELAALARACQITVAAFEELVPHLRVGAREVDVARRLEQLFAEFGAEDRAFATIVGSGANSAIAHHEPGPRRLTPGDLVVVDAGARVDGYHADMTRTFVVAAADPWQVAVHAVVADAQSAARAACRAGADRRAVDATARDRIAAAGHGEHFGHGLGHGVGLRIHEAPFLGPRSTGTIAGGMAITVEPGVYLPGRGGVRIEDTLVVTPEGPQVLTAAARELRVVG